MNWTTSLQLVRSKEAKYEEDTPMNGIRTTRRGTFATEEEQLALVLELTAMEMEAKPTSLCAAKCGKLGSLRCASCLTALYCDQKCQKKAWSSHKALCKETAENNKKIADDAAEAAGAAVMKAADDIQTLCAAGCGEYALERCSRCVGAKYCGEICQKKAWPEHLKACKVAAPILLMLGGDASAIEILDEKIKTFRKLGEKGNAAAQCSLGLCFLFGTGISIDKKEAIRWLTRSAGSGCCDAMFCLGSSYFFGNHGIAVNKPEGLKWHKYAADAGFKLSIDALYEISLDEY